MVFLRVLEMLVMVTINLLSLPGVDGLLESVGDAGHGHRPSRGAVLSAAQQKTQLNNYLNKNKNRTIFVSVFETIGTIVPIPALKRNSGWDTKNAYYKKLGDNGTK